MLDRPTNCGDLGYQFGNFMQGSNSTAGTRGLGVRWR